MVLLDWGLLWVAEFQKLAQKFEGSTSPPWLFPSTLCPYFANVVLVAQALHQGCHATAVALHLCSICGLVFSQCRTTVALHP